MSMFICDTNVNKFSDLKILLGLDIISIMCVGVTMKATYALEQYDCAMMFDVNACLYILDIL